MYEMHAGIVLARLGADVTLTDLEPNLPLLAGNCKTNGAVAAAISLQLRVMHVHVHVFTLAAMHHL